MPSYLEDLAHPRHAQLRLVELVQNDCVRRFQILDPSLHQIPGPFQIVVHVDADNLHRILPAIVPFPLRPVRNNLLRIRDPGHHPHLIQLALAETDSLLHVRDVLRRDPQIRARVIDQVGSSRGEPEEQSQLHHDEHHGKHNPRQRDRQPYFVVKQISLRQRRHSYFPPLPGSNSPRSVISSIISARPSSGRHSTHGSLHLAMFSEITPCTDAHSVCDTSSASCTSSLKHPALIASCTAHFSIAQASFSGLP